MKDVRNLEYPSLGMVSRTQRGFEFIEFLDCYENKCSLQASSAVESAIWLGITNAEPQVMASDATRIGIETNETSGWVPYPIPEEVQLKTRMHLNRNQVAALIRHLESWMENGTFDLKEPS